MNNSPNTSRGSRVSWGETDNRRSLGMSNEIQRMLASLEQKICDQTSAHHELKQDFQKISTTVDAFCEEHKSFHEYREKLEGKLAALEADNKSFHEHCQKLERRLAALESRNSDYEARLPQAMISGNPIYNPRSDYIDPIYKKNDCHLRSHYQNGPPPLVSNTVSPQLFPSPRFCYPHVGMHLVPMENDVYANQECVNAQSISTPKIFAANNLPGERLALLHRTQDFVRRMGYASVTEDFNGTIYVKKDDHSKPLPIRGYGDLNNLENPQV